MNPMRMETRGAATADSLPQETTLHLLDFLDAVSLAHCAQTHSAWRRLASTDLLWHRLCKTEFGIDGGKADYTSRWQQEKRHALANLKLYIDFLDEIYFALAAFFALVSISVVLPALVVLKLDGWLVISWTQVLGSVYGLCFLAVMFVLTRATLALTVLVQHPSLSKCVNYCGTLQIAKRTVFNQDVFLKFVVLMGPPAGFVVVAIAIQRQWLFISRFAIFVVWIYSTRAFRRSPPTIQSTRHAFASSRMIGAFAASSLLLAKLIISESLPWTVITGPFTLSPWLMFKHSTISLFLSRRRVLPRGDGSSRSLRQLVSDEGIRYYQHNLPLVSLTLLSLKLDRYLVIPWAAVSIDYFLWVLFGPVATHARHLVCVMFREMPIPATLRQL